MQLPATSFRAEGCDASRSRGFPHRKGGHRARGFPIVEPVGDGDAMPVATDPDNPAPAAASVAPAAIAEVAAAPDRWEAMIAAITRCSRESFLTGVVCSERVRLQYCDGYWGEVPQCRGATRPDTSR